MMLSTKFVNFMQVTDNIDDISVFYDSMQAMIKTPNNDSILLVFKDMSCIMFNTEGYVAFDSPHEVAHNMRLIEREFPNLMDELDRICGVTNG